DCQPEREQGTCFAFAKKQLPRADRSWPGNDNLFARPRMPLMPPYPRQSMNAYVNSLPVNAGSIGANAWPSPSQPCSTTTAWGPWPTRWCEFNSRKNREKRSRTSWSGLQDPFAVFDLDHHACPRVEPEVIGLAHVDGAVGDAQFLDALQVVAQRAPELFRARLCHLEL